VQTKSKKLKDGSSETLYYDELFRVILVLKALHEYMSRQLSRLNRQTVVLEGLIFIVILFIIRFSIYNVNLLLKRQCL